MQGFRSLRAGEAIAAFHVLGAAAPVIAHARLITYMTAPAHAPRSRYEHLKRAAYVGKEVVLTAMFFTTWVFMWCASLRCSSQPGR